MKACIKNINGEITFVLKDKSKNIVETINASKDNDIYSAKITEEILSKMGETIGTVELKADGQVLNSIKILFNMPEIEADDKIVDDFEGYLGESALIENSSTI